MKWLAALLFAVVAFNAGTLFFVSPYYNYGAEGLELAALMRMGRGLPYATGIDEVPLFLNQYSPYFYALTHALAELFGTHSLEGVALSMRLLQVAASGALMVFVGRTYAHWRRGWSSFAAVAGWFLVLFPANVFAVRPDWIAFLLEGGAFLSWLHSSSCRQSPWLAARTGIVCGLAMVFKLNTLGVLSGLCLFLLARRRWSEACGLALGAALTFTAAAAAAREIWGDALLQSTLLSIMNRSESLRSGLHRLLGFVPYAGPFAALVWLGLRAEATRKDRVSSDERAATSLVLLASFGLATVQQIKFGAWYNYYFGFFAIGMGPAAAGLEEFLRTRSWVPRGAALALALGHVAWSIRTPLVIWRDHVDGNHPIRAAERWLEAHKPSGAVYTADPNMSVYLEQRSLLGPQTELIISVTPKLAAQIPKIRARLHRQGFVAAVVSGPRCASSLPRGIFSTETRELTYLAKQLGWICIFTRPEAPPAK